MAVKIRRETVTVKNGNTSINAVEVRRPARRPKTGLSYKDPRNSGCVQNVLSPPLCAVFDKKKGEIV